MTDTTTHASLTPVTVQLADLSEYDNPTRIYQGLLPDGAEIPTSAAITDEGELRWDTTLVAVLSLDIRRLVEQPLCRSGNQTEIYDLTPTLRLGGGGGPLHATCMKSRLRVRSSARVRVRSRTRTDTHPAANRPLFGVYTDRVLHDRAAWAGVIYRIETDLDGPKLKPR